MSEPTSLYRKFTGTAGVMIISRCLAMVSGILYARYLGPEQFGLYSFILSIIALATLPVVAGLPNLLVREVASFQYSERWDLLKGVINWSLIYSLLSSIMIIFILYFIIDIGLIGQPVSGLLLGALLLIPFKAILSLESSILNGLRKPMLAQFPIKIFVPIFKLIILTICILSCADELSATLLIDISIYASICSFLIALAFLKRLLKAPFFNCGSTYKNKEWISSLIPFTLIAFIGTLNTEIASLLLGLLNSSTSVAYFKVAVQGVSLIALGFSSINAVIMPDIAMLYKKGKQKETQALLTKSVRLSVLISLPITLILILFGKPIILLLFGSEYLSSYPILVILCIGRLVNVLMGSVGLVLNMTGNEKSVLKVLLITLVFNIILLVVLVPHYGGVGAALAVSISLILWNALMAIEVWKLTKLKTWFF